VNGLVEGLLNLASPWGYVLVALLAGLESAAFVGLVIPGETAMLLGGVLAFTGHASLLVMMGCGVLGAIVGDSVGYELGRRFGDPLRRSRLGRRISAARWERAEEYVRRRGGVAAFLGRFVGVLRALVPFVAGASRLPYRTFLPFNALGALIWAPGFVYLGFLAGHSYQRVERLAGRASLLVGVGVVGLAALVVAARWITRHPDRALAPLRYLAARPAVARLQRRYARQLDFLAARLNPTAALGLALTAQLAILALLGAAFSAVTEDVVTRDELVRLDDPVSRFLIEHREPWLTTVMKIITDLGTAFVLIPLLLAVGVLARWRRGTWRPLGFLALTLAGASLTSTVIKLLVARPRPDTHALVIALGYGFPSGHSTAAAAGWLSAALVLGWLTRSVALRVSLGAGAAVVVMLVGVSRVYLGVHQPTDVLGGWALGTLWLAAVLTAFHLLVNRQAGRNDTGHAAHDDPTAGQAAPSRWSTGPGSAPHES
jgi:membrane protein DedA with SNARE-associated domain/membrane-associated phospholipid phosphatase